MAVSLVVGGVLVFGCGGGDSTPAPAATPETMPAPGADGGPPAPMDGDAGPSLAVLPATLTVPVGRSQIFVAPGSMGVTWSVMEGASGGAVDANGRYTAPLTPGTYHLVASAGGKTGAVTVKVADYTLSVLAGAPGGTGNLDGTGSAARFHQPFAITNDGAGILYVADTYSGTIRKVVAATGVVTTIAGGGSFGFADGVGAAATFSAVSALALDKVNGVLYAADSGNNAIRAIDLATGAVTTFAGGNKQPGSTDGIGTAAKFYGPSGIAYVAGVLYVSDTNNSTLRRIAVATKQVTTVAGLANTSAATNGIGSLARFQAPGGITAVDATLLYLADYVSNTIRRIDINGGTAYVVTTYAGVATAGHVDGASNTAQFNSPTDVAVAGGTVFVCDGTNNDIRSIALTTVATVAGTNNYASNDGVGTAAGLSRPTGITTDGTTLWIADQYNSAIRSIDIATKTVTTIAGKAGTFGTTSGIVVASGKIYVADTGNNVIRQLDPVSKSVSTAFGSLMRIAGADDGVGTAARFSAPSGLATDGNGHLFVADATNATVRAIDLTSGMVTTLAGTAGAVGSSDGLGAQARFVQPSGLFWDGEGSLFVADEGDSTLRRIYVATRAVATFAGQPRQMGIRPGPIQTALLNTPSRLVRTSNGAFVINSGREGVLLELAPQ
jgi:sugar lactone lactonase YvrE